jgi:hypothetical protein
MVGRTSFQDLAMIAIYSSIRNFSKDIITYTFNKCHPKSSFYVWLVQNMIANFEDNAQLNITNRDLAEATSSYTSRNLLLTRNTTLRKNLIREVDCYKA